MKRISSYLSVFVLLSSFPGLARICSAQSDQVPAPIDASEPQSQPQTSAYEPYSSEQLDNLLAPIALYPDPLLAQVLLAATFPDQIQDAAEWMRAHNPNDIDDQPWDVSVKAVAHYSTVLAMLSDRLDWTTALGQAYVYESTNIMTSVQRLRNSAYSEGNLIETPEQHLTIEDGGYIQIVPAQPEFIFVPEYDAGVIYARRVYREGFGFDGFFRFGGRYAIGAWLNHDLDWHSHRLVYDSWEAHHDGWRERSRPFVHATNVYVNERFEQVTVNKNVVIRRVNYENVERYNSVHRDVNFENRAKIEADRVRNEELRASHAHPQSQDARVEARGNDHGNQPGVRNEPSAASRPQPPNQGEDGARHANFERLNQTLSDGASPRPQGPNQANAERGTGRGIPSGLPNQPPNERQSQLPKAPSSANLEHANQAATVGASRPQSPKQAEAPSRGAKFVYTNDTVPHVEPSTPQPPNARLDSKGNGRENQVDVRGQSSAAPGQPAKTLSPHLPSPTVSRPESPARPPNESHAELETKQQPKAQPKPVEAPHPQIQLNQGKKNPKDKRDE